MPIYEFICRQCGAEFESLVRGDEKVLCPNCNSRRLEKQFSAPVAHSTSAADKCPQRNACPAEHCCGQSCGLNDWPG